jgi:hypothetical protein
VPYSETWGRALCLACEPHGVRGACVENLSTASGALGEETVAKFGILPIVDLGNNM